ncbi:centromere protein F [Crotalus tigris]|uniref:centromere protein F n=1 Tax=Crotalus tigris TaxID=88082 RepID=UPI00192F9C6A|nr:centromere protein F [Crotalus tigris]
MSWVVEEWKEGLSTRVLQKIHDLESQVEKFKKERQQRQFQLESLEAALEKQKQKVVKEKNEGATLKRENQNLMELCDNLEKNRQKLFHELQMKESEINFQEGQLISSKKQVESLEQDLKRYKSELERQPKTFGSGNTSFENTPQRINTGSPTAIYNDSKIKDLQRKSCKEIEERKYLEAEPKSMTSQKKTNALHSEGNITRREIARHQASSCVFSWQQEQTPSHLLSSHRETPHSNGSTKSQFPLESAVTLNPNVIKLTKKDFINCNVSNNSQDSSAIEQLKTQNQELRCRIQELENKLQIQTQDVKANVMKLQDTHLQVENMQMELTEKEKTLNKATNEIIKIRIQLNQTTDQLTAKEKKFRELSNELNCQKQNFESVQCASQQKIKDKDQEILTTKQQFEKNAKDYAQKLSQLEQALQTMQLKEKELKENYEEIKKQNNFLSCQSAEHLQEISQLKEGLCSTKLSLQQSQHFAEDLKNKNCSLKKEFKLLEEKLNKQDNSVSLEKMSLAVSDVEHEHNSLQQILKDKENVIEELNKKLENTETLQKTTLECKDLKKEIMILSQWKKKSKQLLNELDLEKEELMSKIQSLENALKAEQLKHQEKEIALQDEHEQFSEQLNIFEQVVKDKTTELEAQRKAYSDLQQRTAMSEEKLQKERENNSLKLFEFTREMDILQKRLDSEANEGLKKEKCIVSLETSLASYVQLNAFLQKQVEELVQTRDEMERLAEKEDPKQQIFIQEMEQHISELQETVFQKEGLLSKALAALEGKNENLQKLIEESNRQQTEIQDLKESNVLLKDLIQHLKVMGLKETNVSTKIFSERDETEGLPNENSMFENTVNILEEKVLNMEQEISKSFREWRESLLEWSQGKQEASLLLPEADEEVERKSTKEDYLGSIRNRTCHLKVQKAISDIPKKPLMNKCEQLQTKPMSLEKKKNNLLWQLEKNHSVSEETNSLRKEETGENNRRPSVNILLQTLISEMKVSEHAALDFVLNEPALEQLRVFVEERENEVKKCQVKLELLQMDLEDREISLENYADQIKDLEMILRIREIKMEESEMEKEKLLHKLQALKDLQNSASKITEISEDDQSPMCFSAVIKDNFNLQKDAKCSSLPHDLMPSQNDYLQLVSSLHMTMSKLNELEKMCEHLQKEDSALASQLKDSQLECIINTDIMRKELIEKMDRLKVKTISVSDKLKDKSKMEAQSDMKEVPLITPEGYMQFDYEYLKLINKEIKTQLNEIKEKIFSLKKEYEILYVQNLNVAFELSELESCNEMLKDKTIALPIFNKAELVSFPVRMMQSSVNKEFKAYGKFCMETLYDREVFSHTKRMFMESDLENGVSSNEVGRQIDLEDSFEQFNIADELYSDDAWAFLTKPMAMSKHFQCEYCEHSFKVLKESFRSQKILESKEIEKIQELLLSAKKEVDGLRKGSISGNDHWQQKIHKVILQVVSELPAEKKLPKLFSQKQGELQDLDLSFHPIICADAGQPISANQPPNPLCYLKMDSFLGESLGLKAINDQAVKIYEANRRQKSSAYVANITSTEKYFPHINKANDRSIHSSRCPLESSFFPSNISTHMLGNSMENQKATEMLWLSIKKAGNNNSKLFHNVEESNKIINMEVQYLHSDLNSKNTELTEEVACAECNKRAVVLEQEKEDLNEVLQTVPFDTQQLSFNFMTRELELNKVKSEWGMYKSRLPDATHTLEELQMIKADNTQKLFEAETELSRIKSEKTNCETYTLAMETDTEKLLSKSKRLEQEKQIKIKNIFGLHEQLKIITAERNQSNQTTLLRDKEVLDQLCSKMEKNIKEFDSNQMDSIEFIKVLKAERKTQAKFLPAAKAAKDQLSVENVCYVVQFQNLDRVMRDLMLEKEAAEIQIKYLTDAREVTLREYEILHSKLSIFEAKNAKISKSLEGSLVEKGELAARLNSAQVKADQLRQGIEKLKIKIESDERSRHYLAEKLKESNRKADALTDKIEYLERELYMSEENLEDAILRMETAKAETEIIKTDIERMCVRQQHLEGEAEVFKLEKETLEKDLKEKQDKVTSLEVTNSTLINQLKDNEKEKVQIRGECENALRLMESQLKKLCEEIKLLYSEKETFKSKEQDLICEITSLKHDNMQLVGYLQEAQSSSSTVEQLMRAFIQELQSFKQTLNENVSEPLLQNESLQAIQNDLQVSFKPIEENLEVTPCEKAIFEKANSLNQILQLKEEYDSFCHSVQLCLNAYKILKQEKAVMEKQICELETQMKMIAPRFLVDVGAEEIGLELEELKESVEEKTKEANHNLEKYCALLIKHDKLEEENEMLRTQVSLLNTCLKRLSNDTSSSLRSFQNPVEINGLLTERADVPKIMKKGERCEENRINEYSCPCISHQASLEPRMDSCLFSPSLKSPTFIDNSQITEKVKTENLKTTAEGSRLQKMNHDQVDSLDQDFIPRSPLSISSLSSQKVAERPTNHLDIRYFPSTKENDLDKACHVQ